MKWTYLIPHTICLTPVFLINSYYAYILLKVFINNNLNKDPTINIDLQIGTISAIFAYLLANFLVSIFLRIYINLLQSEKITITKTHWMDITTITSILQLPVLCACRCSKMLLTVFPIITLGCMILSITEIGFPYRSRESVQKYDVRHTHRVFYNFTNDLETDSGYMIRSWDRNFDYPNKFPLENITLKTNVFNKCQINRTTFCHIPLFDQYETVEGIHFLPGSEPKIKNKVKVDINQVTTDDFEGTITFDMMISGPPYIFIVITPIKNNTLIAYSETSELRKETNNPMFLRIMSNTGYSKSNLTLMFSVSKHC